MSSSSNRWQVNVDMRLSLDDEQDDPIRVPTSSKKKRHRYAVLDDDDDEQYNVDKTESYHGRHESFQQTYESDRFELPEQNESSDEEESEHEETLVSAPSTAASYFPKVTSTSQPRYKPRLDENHEEEEDYYSGNAIHGATTRTQHDRDSTYSQDYDMPLHQPSPQHEVVDLCASDDDSIQEEEDFAAPHIKYRNGVRTSQKSPKFNANSRGFFFSPRQDRPRQAAPVVAAMPSMTLDDDDILECWSSEDEGDRKPRARRVTDQHDSQQQAGSSRWNARESQNEDDPIFGDTTRRAKALSNRAARQPPVYDSQAGDDDIEQVHVPAPSRKRQDTLNQFKADRGERRRRLRDATNSMNTAAAVVLRDRAPFEQTSNNVWYRQGSSFPPPPAPLRNDLAGGSGVGAGSYTFNSSTHQSGQASFSTKGRKKKTATKRATKAGGKKKKWGGGRRNYYKRKKGKGASRSNSGWSNRTASNEEYSREDPNLKHVGGANIIF